MSKRKKYIIPSEDGQSAVRIESEPILVENDFNCPKCGGQNPYSPDGEIRICYDCKDFCWHKSKDAQYLQVNEGRAEEIRKFMVD